MCVPLRQILDELPQIRLISGVEEEDLKAGVFLEISIQGYLKIEHAFAFYTIQSRSGGLVKCRIASE